MVLPCFTMVFPWFSHEFQAMFALFLPRFTTHRGGVVNDALFQVKVLQQELADQSERHGKELKRRSLWRIPVGIHGMIYELNIWWLDVIGDWWLVIGDDDDDDDKYVIVMILIGDDDDDIVENYINKKKLWYISMYVIILVIVVVICPICDLSFVYRAWSWFSFCPCCDRNWIGWLPGKSFKVEWIPIIAKIGVPIVNSLEGI